MPITLSQGDKAPDFSLKESNGATVSLSTVAGSRVILHFHENGFEDCGFASILEECKKRDIRIVCVSREAALTQGVLSLADPSLEVAKTYGVYGKRVQEARTVLGLSRTTFLLDEDGVIMRVFPSITPEGHAADALAGFGDR